MNPGLLNLRIRIERRVTTADEAGQPVETWVVVGRCRARGMTPKDRGEAVAGDRDTEQRGKIFRVRSHPFLGIYAAGDRLAEEERTDHPETGWKIAGWSEVDGSNGMYVDVTAHSPESRTAAQAVPPQVLPGTVDGGDADDLVDAEMDGGGA